MCLLFTYWILGLFWKCGIVCLLFILFYSARFVIGYFAVFLTNDDLLFHGFPECTVFSEIWKWHKQMIYTVGCISYLNETRIHYSSKNRIIGDGTLTSGAPEVTTGFSWGSCFSVFSFLCSVLVIIVFSFVFFFRHFIVCPSSKYGFSSPLLYLQTFLTFNIILQEYGKNGGQLQ